MYALSARFKEEKTTHLSPRSIVVTLTSQMAE